MGTSSSWLDGRPVAPSAQPCRHDSCSPARCRGSREAGKLPADPNDQGRPDSGLGIANESDNHTMNTTPDRNREMNLMNEDLARAQISSRLGEARELRRGHQLVLARRLSRRAERAAQQARLALARSI